MVWWCIFVNECAKIGRFGRSNIDILQCRQSLVQLNCLLPQHTAHKTQQPTKMIHCRPTPQRLCPLLPWQQPPRPQLLAQRLQTISCNAPAGVFGHAGRRLFFSNQHTRVHPPRYLALHHCDHRHSPCHHPTCGFCQQIRVHLVCQHFLNVRLFQQLFAR